MINRKSKQTVEFTWNGRKKTRKGNTLCSLYPSWFTDDRQRTYLQPSAILWKRLELTRVMFLFLLVRCEIRLTSLANEWFCSYLLVTNSALELSASPVVFEVTWYSSVCDDGCRNKQASWFVYVSNGTPEEMGKGQAKSPVCTFCEMKQRCKSKAVHIRNNINRLHTALEGVEKQLELYTKRRGNICAVVIAPEHYNSILSYQ